VPCMKFLTILTGGGLISGQYPERGSQFELRTCRAREICRLIRVGGPCLAAVARRYCRIGQG
jgi:hypothetical protein